MAYAVYMTESFEKEMMKLSDSDRKIIEKLFVQLKENPFVGDILRYHFFREKRLREKRIYYLIYDELNCVLIVAIGNKKTQQETIDKIIELLPEFKEYITKIMHES
ncbi:MAG TPA: hypothetical protein P5277_01770 [Candidatus Paceibacterota bacterium]|nr:hypothetical protein [Candidatus Paceibacterota bacterium]